MCVRSPKTNLPRKFVFITLSLSIFFRRRATLRNCRNIVIVTKRYVQPSEHTSTAEVSSAQTCSENGEWKYFIFRLPLQPSWISNFAVCPLPPSRFDNLIRLYWYHYRELSDFSFYTSGRKNASRFFSSTILFSKRGTRIQFRYSINCNCTKASCYLTYWMLLIGNGNGRITNQYLYTQ